MKYKGIICAMITPFDENQNINSQATCQLIDYLIEKGIYGLFILGTNGECHVLTDDEKLNLQRLLLIIQIIVYLFLLEQVVIQLVKL